MKTISIVFVTFSLLLCSCSSSDELAKENISQIIRTASRPIQAEAQSENYVIRQGDQIKISVWGYPEFTSEGPVKETGTFTIPLLGELVTAGLTKEQFTEQLKKKLAVYVKGEIQLTVTIISTILPKVAVLGAVTRQDNYTITNEVSLIEILSTAGGTTQDSDLRHIKIIRPTKNNEPIEVDLITYIEKGKVETIPMVHPGDTVYIPKKSNIVRELSDFMRDAIFIFGFFRIFN